MTKRERFVLTAVLCDCGVLRGDIPKILSYFEDTGRIYGTMLKQIESLRDHFLNRGYDKESLSKIMSDPRLYDHSVKKIINSEDVLRSNGYTDDEIKQVEVVGSSMFGHDKDTLDKKILFYNDVGIKNLIVRNSRNLIQGLSLSYARVHFLQDRNSFNNDAERMKTFCTRERFAYEFSISKELLLNRYPITEERYLVKKRGN